MNTPGPSDELLSASLDGEVTADEQEAVDAALARSPERRAMLADLAAARDAVRTMDEPELPTRFLAGIADAVARDDAEFDVRAERTRSSGSRRRLTWLAGGVAAAALVAALVIPASDRVDPAVSARVDTHAARASVSEDPVSELAPVIAATGGIRR